MKTCSVLFLGSLFLGSAVQAALPLLSASARVASAQGYNDFPWFYFQSVLERGWLGVAVAGGPSQPSPSLA